MQQLCAGRRRKRMSTCSIMESIKEVTGHRWLTSATKLFVFFPRKMSFVVAFDIWKGKLKIFWCNSVELNWMLHWFIAQVVKNITRAQSTKTGTMAPHHQLDHSIIILWHNRHQVVVGMDLHHLHRWWRAVIWALISRVLIVLPCLLRHQILLLGSTKVPSHMMSLQQLQEDLLRPIY